MRYRPSYCGVKVWPKRVTVQQFAGQAGGLFLLHVDAAYACSRPAAVARGRAEVTRLHGARLPPGGCCFEPGGHCSPREPGMSRSSRQAR